MVKNVLNKLYVDKENHEYLMKNYQEGSRFKLFSGVFFGKMGVMTKANWMMLLFCLPAFAVLFYTYYLSIKYAAYTPFSANFGIGYPVVPNAELIYGELIFKNNMFRALLLIPCIIIGFVGLAGAFNIIKYESLGMHVKIFRTFFKGIKNNFVTHMWLGLINSIFFFLLVLSFNNFGVTDLALGWKITSIALSIIIMAFSAVMSMYIMTMTALYDMPLRKMIGNAFWLTISFVLQNVIILIFSLVPVVLLIFMNTSMFLQIIVIMICAMLGFSYIITIWTIYNHYVYGMLFTARLEQQSGKKKNRAVKAEPVPSPEPQAQAKPPQQPQGAQPNRPKNKKPASNGGKKNKKKGR